MKLWEVIKELTEDPTKVFTDGQGNYLKFTDEELLSWHSLTDEFCGLYTFQRDDATNWQLVRQPVTWQEAIEVWAEGKVVYVENKAGGRVYRHGGEGGRMYLLQSEITTGTWYVED